MYRRLIALLALAGCGALCAAPAVAKIALASALRPHPAPAPRVTLPPPPAAAVLPPVPAVARGYAAPSANVPSAEIEGVTQRPFVGLTLENAIGMALSQNPDLAVAQADRAIAGYQIQAAKGAYDIRLSLQPSYQYAKTAPSNSFFAGPQFGPLVSETTGVSAGASGILRGGQQYSVSVQGGSLFSNNVINSFDPTYPTLFSVGFSQPLARGAGINPAGRALQLAQINADAVDAQTLVGIESTVAQVEDSYWDLVAAWRNVAIAEEALKQAVAQQRSNERLAKRGASAPIDVVQSNAQVEIFQDNVFSALQSVAQIQNRLKELLLANPADPAWAANIVPTTPVLQLPKQPSLAALVMTALRNRPEIARIRDERRAADVDLAYAENRLKPQIDLNLGYTSNGFAGQPTNPNASPFAQSSAQQVVAIDQLITAVNRSLPANQQIPYLMQANAPVPGYLIGDLGQSIKNLTAEKFPSFSAGILVTLPLGHDTAHADLAIARERERIERLQEANIIQRVTVEVRDALQAYKSAVARLIAARAAAQASQQVLASEMRRFRNGASTTFLVLQRQVELADNRGRELQAQTDLNKAVVEIERSTGSILKDNDVDLTTLGRGALKP